MRAPSPEKRTPPARGASAVVAMESSKKPLSSTPDQHLQDLSVLETDIATALEYEKHLARKQYRLRQFILNLKAKRDHLADLGDLLADRRAAA